MTVMRSLSLTFAVVLSTSGPALANPFAGLGEGQTANLIIAAFLVACAALGGYFIYSGIKNRGVAKASTSWPTAGGTVLYSDVEQRKAYSREKRRTYYKYEPIVRYSYKVAGTSYENSVIRFGDLVRNSRYFPEELVEKYPVGSTVAVRYDPNDPARSTLETVSAGGRQIMTGALFIGVSLFIGALVTLLGGGPNLPPEVTEQLNRPN